MKKMTKTLVLALALLATIAAGVVSVSVSARADGSDPFPTCKPWPKCANQ